MSHEVETLRARYDAIGRRDWAAVFDAVDPDFELRTPGRSLGAGTYHGRDAAAQAFEDFFEPYEEVTVEPQQFFERGERIVVFFIQRCRPTGSSAIVEINAAHLWTMREGKATSLEIFPERDKALRAADKLSERGVGA
jgi:ketosteroid isomerase-like protein